MEYFKEAHIWEIEVRPSEGSEHSELPNVALYTYTNLIRSSIRPSQHYHQLR